MNKIKLNYKQQFLFLLIGSLTVSGLMGIYIFLFGTFGETQAKLLLTTLTISAYSLTGLACSILFEKNIYKIFSLSGIAISSLGFLVTTLTIWNYNLLDNIWKFIIALSILAFSFAHMSLLLLINSKNKLVRYSLRASIISISILALMLIILVFGEFDPQELYFRFLGVISIIDVLGTITTPILYKIYK